MAASLIPSVAGFASTATLCPRISCRPNTVSLDSKGSGVLLGIRVRTTCSALSTGAGGGWDVQHKDVAGQTPEAARWEAHGSILHAPHTPTARACPAAVSGGEENVLLQQQPEQATASPPRPHREGFLYGPFVDFAVEELSRCPHVSPVILQEEFRNMTAQDQTATIDNKAFTSSKIRMFRVASIDTGAMQIYTQSHLYIALNLTEPLVHCPKSQILNVAGFARPEYDLPIFCADFFSVPNRNIVVLDLNPLYNTDSYQSYKERYYNDLIPLANKHMKFLPWGDKLTAESVQFFSPLVLWSKPQRQDIPRYLYAAFQEYLQAWLNMVDSAQPAVDAVAIASNQEAQHRYISWRTTKDPGRPLLTKLYGEQLAERYIREFLFSGHSTLGTKTFLDYFPEYRGVDGSISRQRSMIGRSFETRPWDKDGNFSPE